MALPRIHEHPVIKEKLALMAELKEALKSNSYAKQAPAPIAAATVDDMARAAARGEELPSQAWREQNMFKVAEENDRRRDLISRGYDSAQREIINLKAAAFKEIEPAVRARHAAAVKGIAEAVIALAKANQVETDLCEEIRAAGYSPLGITEFRFGARGLIGTFEQASDDWLSRIDLEFGTKFVSKLAK